MAASKLLALMRTLTSGVHEVSVAVRDVKDINRVVEKVAKDATLDSSSAFEIESIKQSLREAAILSGRFVVASKGLAKYSSSDGHIQQIKEDLAAGNSQRLKLFLDGIASHLSRCRMRVEEYQAEYNKVNESLRQLTESIEMTDIRDNITEQEVSCRSYIAGVTIGVLLPGLIALVFREFSLLFLFVYACFGVGGVVIGKKGYSFLLNWSQSPRSLRRARGIRLYNNELQLQSTLESIATFLGKAPGTRSKLLQLEQCAKEGSECVATVVQQSLGSAHQFNEADKYNQLKVQLDDLQRQMTQLLKCAEEESDTEQH